MGKKDLAMESGQTTEQKDTPENVIDAARKFVRAEADVKCEIAGKREEGDNIIYEIEPEISNWSYRWS